MSGPDRAQHGQRAWQHPLRTVCLALIRFYQLWISPAIPPSCRFYPSCSAYASTAVERFGPVTGLRLAAGRLARCNPWNPGGVDHVPPRRPDGRPDRRADTSAHIITRHTS